MSSIRTRVESAALPEVPTPAQTAAFLSVVLDYTIHLRNVVKPDDPRELVAEVKTARRFVHVIADHRVLPLAQQTASEYRWPIEAEDKPWLLKEVLTRLRDMVHESEVLLPADDFSQWQRDNFWKRTLLNLEYLTFAWNQETEDARRKLREATDGFQRMMDVVNQVYRAERTDHSTNEDPVSETSSDEEDSDGEEANPEGDDAGYSSADLNEG